MEIIRLSGYTEDEKAAIAHRHLVPRQISEHGLKEGELTIEETALMDIIRLYTREAGVRSLEREIAKIARKAVTKIVTNDTKTITVTSDCLDEYLGVKKFRFGEIDTDDQVGVVTGLAWTEVGGELLQIESVKVPGKGKITATGKLGDVMKESIQAAEFFIKSRAHSYGVDLTKLEKQDIHVHVPEGATPKDGPSAGIAMATSIISSISGIPVHNDVAMTGEITLLGRVLPIGGLKEKLLAALRGGIKTVLIPKENEKDLADVPENVKEGLTIIPIAIVDEALNVALIRPFSVESSDDEQDKQVGTPPLAPESTHSDDIVAH
jgi:ATP-dependent Lon protease